MISCEERGEVSEKRFFQALSVRTEKTPDWFRKVKGVSAGMDVRGVDALALVSCSQREKPIKVPIQIKSSARARIEYFAKHPESWLAGVPVVVIEETATDEEIRQSVYAQLAPIQAQGICFDDFLKSLFEGKLSAKGFQLKKDAGTKKRLR